MIRNALFLFAPKFCEFGADVAAAFAALQPDPSAVRVHGLCTGARKTQARVQAALADRAGQVDYLPERERDWVAQRPTAADIAWFDAAYAPGTLGRTITADRRIGRGYVRNGRTRPDLLGDAVLADPEHAPLSYAVGLYRYLETLFDQIRPDVVFCYAVAGAPAYAMGEVCERRGIPFLQLQPTRLGARYAVDTDRRGLLRATAVRFRSGVPASADAMAEAQAFLDDFRARPDVPEYMIANKRRQATKQTYMKAFSLARGSAQRAIGAWIGGNPERKEKTRRGFFEAETICRQKRDATKEAQVTEDLPDRFVFFPLHVSPEASTMVLAPDHTEQLSVIEALSKALPAGVSLVVKEHWPMVGMRPAGFYDAIDRMPGVRRVQAYLPGLALTQKADLVTVITGTAAWEAFLLGRPSLCMAEMQFHCVPGAGRIEGDLRALPQAIRAARAQQPAATADVVRYLAALLETSFELPSHLLWDEYRDAPREERDRVCGDIACHMQARLAEPPVTPVGQP